MAVRPNCPICRNGAALVYSGLKRSMDLYAPSFPAPFNALASNCTHSNGTIQKRNGISNSAPRPNALHLAPSLFGPEEVHGFVSPLLPAPFNALTNNCPAIPAELFERNGISNSAHVLMPLHSVPKHKTFDLVYRIN
ncbi:hypothetical protein CEXT_648041 [Caerostris extrusa]|uniref:Uncharacterized protein n=1 Tax=Caerostris extrusa TaxID=172846 RepID=A0AAV4Y009_CAEEX|nr:hypothetical protein CEXT_648041 [Caerostris extrusa]